MPFRKKQPDDQITQRMFLEQVLREKQKRRVEGLSSFSEWLPSASPELTWNFPHLLYIQKHLEMIARGEIKRLAIFIPPQFGKSECVTIRFPAYLLEKNPKTRIVVGAYGATLAENFSRDTRKLVRARRIVELDEDRQAVHEWLTTQGGGLKAVGVGGAITGFSADIVIIDDPVKKRDEANSPTYRESVWNWYKTEIYTRQQASTPIILIMTRWHEDDLAGRILSDNPIGTPYEWKIISLPGKCEGSDPSDYPVHREIGETLCEQLHPQTQVDNFEVVLGSDFSALYQQHPSPLEGDIWKAAWFHEGKDINLPLLTANKFPDGVKLTQVWDTSLEVNEKNDPCAMVEGCMGSDGNIYVAAMVNERLEFPSLIQRMRTEAERVRGPVEICAEDKANAKPARQQLKLAGIPLIEVPSGTVDKTVRAKSVSHYAEAGNVILVSQYGNLNSELLTQLFIFNNGRHDDLHDAFVHLLRRITGHATEWDEDVLVKMMESA